MSDNVTNFETDEKINKNDLINLYNEFVGSFSASLFSSGIISEIDEEQLKTYLSNPDNYIDEIQKLVQYYYISNGDVFQLFDMTRILPTLNYKIVSDDETKQREKNTKKCNSILKKVKYKTLTRDLISQEILAGTLIGIWLGDKKNPYFYTFNDLKYVFPAYRKNGEWVAFYDLSQLNSLDDFGRDIIFQSLYPYITKDKYDTYLNDNSKKYIELPQDRTAVLRTHTLHRNQRYGTSWATQGLNSVLHKKKLKDMEKAIANKIMNAVVLLKLGNKDKPNSGINSNLKRKVHNGVKAGLEKNNKTGISVLSIPDWSDLTFPEIKNGDTALDSKKFEGINDDINTSYGISSTLLNGKGSNYASAKVNLEIFYKRIAVLLEDIEEIYNKLFNLVLPNNVKDQYYLEFDKQMPIDEKTKIELLTKLHSSEGFSLKSVIDEIPDLNFDDYIEQSLYEQEEMKIQDRIKPYASAYTSSGNNDDEKGRPEIDDNDLENESTIRNKENLGNEQ